ncbi:MAG: aromatic acid decarboxylase [Coxiella sp. (in: Bacteria)]|nr:MAG: aromatic acid decarboxylase [Coxiella sp. (in: g-proteobacteria)]
MSKQPPFVVGISGASGIQYGICLLKVLRDQGIPTHLIVSSAAQMVCNCETELSLQHLKSLCDVYYNPKDFLAPIASGGMKTAGMIIAPCSTKSLSEIAHCNPNNLLTRAAEVTLKERRRLVLLLRETPLTLSHIDNMRKVTEMGGIIYPPVPAFYSQPSSLFEMVQHTIYRALALFDIDIPETKIWQGTKQKSHDSALCEMA